jgi:putative transcriptional regulator
MKDVEFNKLVASLKEAGQIRSGQKKPSRVYEMKAPEIKMVRERISASQEEFARMIGVSARTLQNWEQGRRRPEGPAQALLHVAARNPRAVRDALQSG